SRALAAAFPLQHLRFERQEQVGDEARDELLEHPVLFVELEVHGASRPSAPQSTGGTRGMASTRPDLVVSARPRPTRVQAPRLGAIRLNDPSTAPFVRRRLAS